MKRQYIFEKLPHFIHGGDYNPEQWMNTPEVWDEDIKLMKLANCNAMTIGIFSWAFLEPCEGVFDFTFMDIIMDKFQKNDIKVIMATPSGARPRWLAKKYPEVLRVNENRTKNLYGFRHNHCYTSPVYREKTKVVNRKLAERYKDSPSLLLWHISNEYGGECHCPLCQDAFRQWLKIKYNHDLEMLNHEWWTGFWSHRIGDWNEIESPSSIGDTILHGHVLDWKRFVTHQTIDFMNHEIAAIREVCSDIPVTTNMMGPYQTLNYWKMKDFVDVISWDSYPKWHSERGNVVEAYTIAFAYDIHRSLKDQPFLLMESTPSLANWHEYAKLKKPNMHRLSAIQAIAHGSDTVLYFQWRKSRGGCEKFHGAVIGHSGHEQNRVFKDVAELGAMLGKMDDVVGTRTKAEVAIIFDFENRWAIKEAQGFKLEDKEYKKTCIDHYRVFWQSGVNVDVLGSECDLARYKLVILPMLYMMSEKVIASVEKYVREGGTVVATYMTGYVNENDLCYMGGFPGGTLKQVFGLVSEEIDTLYPNEKNHILFNDTEYNAIDYCEIIKSEEAKVLAYYNADFYSGSPAFLENTYGTGKAYYIAFRDDGQFTKDFYEHLIGKLRIEKALSGKLPDGVSAHTRQAGDCKYIFIENYNGHDVEVELYDDYIQLESGEVIKGNVHIAPYDAAVLRMKVVRSGGKTVESSC